MRLPGDASASAGGGVLLPALLSLLLLAGETSGKGAGGTRDGRNAYRYVHEGDAEMLLPLIV